jgi:hydrogenase maturation protease
VKEGSEVSEAHSSGDEKVHLGGIRSAAHLVEHLREALTPNAVVVCVGNDLNADDGAGVEIARQLAESVPWRVYDARTVPENFLMRIVGEKPDSLLLIDALDFGGRPGAVEVLEAGLIGGQGPSTHGPAPLAFLELLAMMHPCRCAVLGIQPDCVEVGQAMSEQVREAVDLVTEAFMLLSDEVRARE